MNEISRLVIDTTDCCCVDFFIWNIGTCKIINHVSQCRHRYVSWSPFLSFSLALSLDFFCTSSIFSPFVRVIFSAMRCCCRCLTLVCFLPIREEEGKKNPKNFTRNCFTFGWHQMEANFYCVHLKANAGNRTIYALKFLPLCRIHTNTHILNRHVFQMKITRTIAKSLRTERPRIGSLI